MKYLFLALLLVGCSHMRTKPQSGLAPVNGIQMYYEISGPKDGMPLVLLPGGGSTIDITWSRMIPLLSKKFLVIAVEEQGHGRSTDRDAPVSFEATADDVVATLKHLNISKANVFGFSNGASSALQMAIRHPEMVNKVIFASSLTKKSGGYKWFWEFMKKANFSNMPQPLKDAYLKVAPKPENLRTMHDKDLNRMRTFKNVPDSDLKKIKSPVLVMIGDKDLVTPEHAAELTRLIPNSKLVILPGVHGEYLGEAIVTTKETQYPQITSSIVEEFLK